MTLHFTIRLDVRDALYVALDSLDLSGLGLTGETTYEIADAEFIRLDEENWHLVLELNRTAGQSVAQHEIVSAVTEFFDAELVVDFGEVRQLTPDRHAQRVGEYPPTRRTP